MPERGVNPSTQGTRLTLLGHIERTAELHLEGSTLREGPAHVGCYPPNEANQERGAHHYGEAEGLEVSHRVRAIRRTR